MKTRSKLGLLLGLLVLACGDATAQVFVYDGFGACIAETACQSQIDEARQEAYAAGLSQGTAQGVSGCQASPASCGITLGSVLPPAQYGETEPNDHFVAADVLVLGSRFWGQSYGLDDWDWFYFISDQPNKLLTVHFDVPSRDPTSDDVAGWMVSVVDAAGNTYAQFATSFNADISDANDEISYPVTLGFAGTYYIVVQPAISSELGANLCDLTQGGDPDCKFNFHVYTIAATLTDSLLESPNPYVAFYDAEVERNDTPSLANPLAPGVTMYGLINLRFDGVVEQVEEEGFTWGQGEDDWFYYDSPGNEIITLSFCEREVCGPGNWFVEVYDIAGATAIDGGTDERLVDPMVAFNTNTDNDDFAGDFIAAPGDPNIAEVDPYAVRFGVSAPGRYFVRVNHSRLLTAPCSRYAFVHDDRLACSCDEGTSCAVPVECDPETDAGCSQVPTACLPGIEPGCELIEEVPGSGPFFCDPVLTPGCSLVPRGCDGDPAVECTGTILTVQTRGTCSCAEFGNLVSIPGTEEDPPRVSSQYNFAWHASKLPPFTSETEAFQDAQARPAYFNAP